MKDPRNSRFEVDVKLDAINGSHDLVSSVDRQQQPLTWTPTSAIGQSVVSLWIARNDLLDFERHSSLTFEARARTIACCLVTRISFASAEQYIMIRCLHCMPERRLWQRSGLKAQGLASRLSKRRAHSRYSSHRSTSSRPFLRRAATRSVCWRTHCRTRKSAGFRYPSDGV